MFNLAVCKTGCKAGCKVYTVFYCPYGYWRCPRSMRRRVYVTVEHPSVRPSVCLIDRQQQQQPVALLLSTGTSHDWKVEGDLRWGGWRSAFLLSCAPFRTPIPFSPLKSAKRSREALSSSHCPAKKMTVTKVEGDQIHLIPIIPSRFWCWAPRGQDISIDSCGARCGRRAKLTPSNI